MNSSLKSAAYTALFSFITIFGLSLVGWLGDVLTWATDQSADAVFPDPSVLMKAAAAAAVSALIGLVNFVVRFAQEKTGVGETPVYTPAGE